MKKAISVLLVLMLVLPILIVCLSVPAFAESLYVRKVVSVVYDDSGSMKGSMLVPKDNYKYSSYAMQAFCNMLNSEDQLFITYMSEADSSREIDLTKDGIANSIKSIQDCKHDAPDTPYAAVETAYEKLVSIMEKDSIDSTTQYWLVVITDGVFSATDPNTHEPPKDLEKFVNDNFNKYASTPINGKKPQVTYMGIGNGVMRVDDTHEGIYSYMAASATEIVDNMSKIAHKISGRGSISGNQVNDTTIEVDSTVPLFNIVAIVQNSDAQLKSISHDGKNLTEKRKATMKATDLPSLAGSSYLYDDLGKTMSEGKYTLTFDKAVKASDVIILFEPAIEARVSVSVNGKEVTDLKKLDNLMASDKVSVSYKLYEIGTNKEINMGKLPDGTEFKIKVQEGNKVVKEIIGKDEMLTDYEVKEIETKIVASVTMPDFNPIDFAIEFTPKSYVPTYTVSASLVGNENCILKEDASKNQNVQVSFTVFSDGKQITNPDEVKALGPVITTSVKGNDGEITYTDDGKIVFTPKSASSRPGKDAIFDVDVTCTIDTFREEISASAKYQVDASIFEVVFVAPDKTIKKTELYGNAIAATFYVTKEGVRLNKSEVGEDFTITLNRSRKDLKYTTDISDDGTITVTPQSEEKHIKGFFLTYWMKYFALNGSDIEITLEHQRGTVTGTLDVVGGDGAYVFFNVLLWLGIEILVALAVLAYIIRFMTKSRFNSKAKIYYGKIEISGGSYTLNLNHRKSLNKDNKYVWNPFKPITVELMRTSITALYGGMILCHKAYFEARVNPTEGSSRNAKEIYDACKKDGKGIEIQPITGPRTIEKHLDSGITEGERNFYVIPTNPKEAQGVEVQDAYVFCYVIEK